MARFLFSVWPAHGHIYPTLPIAHALRGAGHAVGYVTTPTFEPLLSAHGMMYLPLDHPHLDSPPPPLPDDLGGRERFKENFRRSFIAPVRAHVVSVRAAVSAWEPDVLVNDYVTYAGLLAGEREGLPVATLVMTLFSWPGANVAPFGLGLPPARDAATRLRYSALHARADAFFADVVAELNDARVDCALPPRDGPLAVATLSPDLVLLLGIPEFDYGRTDLPAQAHYVGTCSWDPPVHLDPATAAWLDALPPQLPLVLVTASTATREVDRHSALLVATALEGLADSGVAVLATLPFDHALHESALPPHMRLVRFVPHSHVLPRATTVVTHGGFGTVIKALSHGCPLVVVPFTGDQPEVAQRVVEAGAGLRLGAAALTPTALREAVVATMQQIHYRLAAERLATYLAARDGPREAAALLLQLATSRSAAVRHNTAQEVQA